MRWCPALKPEGLTGLRLCSKLRQVSFVLLAPLSRFEVKTKCGAAAAPSTTQQHYRVVKQKFLCATTHFSKVFSHHLLFPSETEKVSQNWIIVKLRLPFQETSAFFIFFRDQTCFFSFFLAFFRLIRKDFSCQLSMETWREIRLQMIFLKLPSFFFWVRFFWRIPFCRGEKMSYLECKDTTTRTQHQAILYKL